ncbi:hypothetical protein DMJ13_23345 [halophilic archaeon]|nr:hypothetical protein DMJ13_23345 [halophilic archaeon]
MSGEVIESDLRYIRALLALILLIEFAQAFGGWGVLIGGTLIIVLQSLFFADNEAIYTAVFGGKGNS